MKLAMSISTKQEAALADLKAKHGLSRSEVLKIWAEWSHANGKGFILDFVGKWLKTDAATHMKYFSSV